jgi:NADH dehydrogenase
MKTIQEALDIRSLILQHFERAVITCDKEEQDVFTNFAIIGGGPAGVEMAGALAEFKRYILPKDYPELDAKMMSIYLIEANGKVLKTMSDNASEKALKYLQRMGVEVLLNTRVASYDGQFIKANEVLLEAKTVIWTAGVEGNLPDGIPHESVLRGKRIKVDGFLNLGYYKNIYAIGDIAALIDTENERGHPMVAQVAIQQGELVAMNLLRGLKNKAPKRFVYKDKGSLATIGKRRAVADIGNFKFGGYFAWLLWSVVHLFSISGFRNKVIVGINWAWSYFTYDKGNRLIIRKYKEIPGNESKVMYPFDE